MDRKQAILDASSAIILAKANLSDLLADVYALVMPRSVYAEITATEYPEAAEYIKRVEEKNIKIMDVAPLEPVKAVSLDQGEFDCIQLYLQGGGKFIITDDGQAARYCHRETIPFINALLFPRVLYFGRLRGKEFCENAIGEIVQVGRYSETVISFAQNCSREDVAFALP